MILESIHFGVLCFLAGIGWLILLAMITGKWPIGEKKE
jgi:hypothetical protein